jgi:hypothetical protein
MSVPRLKNGLTPKQDHFSRLVASGQTGAAAYREAYDTNGNPTTVDPNVNALMAVTKVSARIDELRERLASYADINPESIAAELSENRDSAREFGQASPMNNATLLRANLAGILLPQVNVNSRTLHLEASLGEMTPEELRSLIAAGNEARALEDGTGTKVLSEPQP